MLEIIFMFVMLIMAIVWWLWGSLRHDLVAMILLFILVLGGLIPSSQAFIGFSHPAVIMMVAVMIISRSFQDSGIYDYLGRLLDHMSSDAINLTLILSLISALSAAFLTAYATVMLLMPVAIYLGGRRGIHASRLLLPIGFAAVLGSACTMLGSFPNLIISCLQPQCLRIFSFSFTSVPIALTGVLFVALLLWRLLPHSSSKDDRDEQINIEDYITEVKVLKDSILAGSTLRRIMQHVENEVTVIALVRDKLQLEVVDPDEVLLPDDILIIEADSTNLRAFMQFTNAKLIGGRKFQKDMTGARNISMREVVVLKDSHLAGKTASQINIRSRFGVNLLAISRGERKTIHRLGKSKIKVGDVLLIQGRTQILDEVTAAMGCMSLAQRGIKEKDAIRAVVSIVVLATSLLLMSFNVLSAPFALAAAALVLAMFNTVSPFELARSIDWSLVVLLAAMIPVGYAFTASGAAKILANLLGGSGLRIPLWMELGILMTFCMILANLINYIPAAILMSQVALLMASKNPMLSNMYLMAVALSCTAIFASSNKQAINTLIMGAGSYRASDFFKLGFIMQILVLVLGVPLLMWRFG